jgi:hypothetical protein
MNDRLDELSTQLDETLLSAEYLEDDPGEVKKSQIKHVMETLEKAKDRIDGMDSDKPEKR